MSRALWPSASTTWSASIFFAVSQYESAHVAVFDDEVGHALAEADVAAERHDLGAHLLDHADEAKGADVRLGHVENFFRRTGLDELGQHLAREMPRIADLAPELAVREGAGSAFAELHVRFGVEHALTPQPPGVFRAFANLPSALEDDRAEAHLRQHEGGEKPARAEPDDDGPWPQPRPVVGRQFGNEAVPRVGADPDMLIRLEALQQRAFDRRVDELAIDGVDEHHRRLLARVVAAPEDGECFQLDIVDPEPSKHRGTQRRFGVIKR